MTSRTHRWSAVTRHRLSAIIGLTVLILGVPMAAKAQVPGVLSLSPMNVVGGRTAIGTVRLFGPAPTGGRVVQLSSSNPAVAKIPDRVTIQAGDTSVSFGITTLPVSGPGLTYVNISATVTQHSPVRLGVEPAQPSSLTFAPEQVTGGHSTTGHLGLNGPAAGALVVPLSSSSPGVVTVPASVTVPARKTTASFTVTALPVGTSTPVVITASGSLGRNTTTSLTVVPPVLSSFTLAPSTVTGQAHGSATTTGTLTLTGPAPPPARGGGRVVQLSSSHQHMVQVPPTVTVPPGETTVSFGISVLPLGISGGPPVTITLSATAGEVSKTVQLTVNRL
jgi:hypothetical protein